MTKSPRRRNTLMVASQFLKLAADISDTLPMSPLRPICVTALTIVDYSQTASKLKSDYEDLAERVAELVLTVMTESTDTDSVELKTHVDILLGTLQDIQSHMEKQASLGWFWRFVKTSELQDNLSNYVIRLDDCRQLFNLSSLIAIRKLLTKQSPRCLCVPEFATLQNVGPESNQTSQVTAAISAFRVLNHDQVNLKRSLPKKSPSGSFLCRGEFRPEFGTTKFVVKKYSSGANGQQEFLRDIDIWNKLHHPNLHQVLGHSTMSEPLNSPFLLFSDFSYDNIHHHIDQRLRQGEVESFMTTLRLMQGIAAGLEYLQYHTSLSKRDLEECAKAENFVLTPDGQIVVGHNLVTSQSISLQDQTTEILDDWLKEIFWQLVMTFVYGVRPIDMSDWDYSMAQDDGRSARHLRVLESFACYLLPSLSAVTEELSILLEKLEDRYLHNKLSFPNIREAVQSVRSCAFLYRPSTKLQISVGDIGYIQDGRFVVVCNVRDDIAFEFENPPSPFVLTCSGTYKTGRSDGSGRLRHVYNRPSCATIRRYATSEISSNWNIAWSFLLSNAASLCRSNSMKHPNLRAKDLILIVGLQSDLRYSMYDWKDQDDQPPTHVEFVEYETTSPGKPWSYWVVEDNRGVVSNYERFPQTVIFIQLEDGDLQFDHATKFVDI